MQIRIKYSPALILQQHTNVSDPSTRSELVTKTKVSLTRILKRNSGGRTTRGPEDVLGR